MGERAQIARLTLAVLLLTTGCARAAFATAMPTPPAPLARITHAPQSSATESRPVAEATSQATSSTRAPLPESLAELARTAYGKRLVEQIEVPSLNILAPVLAVGWQPVQNALDENTAVEWDSPEASVGWVVSSALPGDGGNILMYGHNNLHASIFLRLSELQTGDVIQLRTGEAEWRYIVQTVDVLPVLTDDQNLDAYEKYFLTTPTEQLTLLSCWPPVSNTHRVVIIAAPETP